jgi:hypothetical protein
MAKEALSTAPVQHWTQGAARLANALLLGIDENVSNREQAQSWENFGKLYMGARGAGGDQAIGPMAGDGAETNPFAKLAAALINSSAPASAGYDPGRHQEGASDLAAASAPDATQRPTAMERIAAALTAPQPSDASQPRGYRNMNPLNIEDGSFARSQPGYAGSDGRFARFASMDQGTAAADKLLSIYGNKGINTVGGVINRWAPASDNNPTNQFAAAVARGAGVDPNTQINLGDPAVRQRLIGPMAQFENGRPLPQQQAALTTPQQPMPSQAAQVQPGQVGGFNSAAVFQVLRDPRLPDAAKMGLLQQLSPDLKQLDLGAEVAFVDGRGNVIRRVPKTEAPSFGVIGKDPYGNENYGWREPRTMTVRPYALPPQPAAGVTGPGQAMPPAPPGYDPKKWRDVQTDAAAKSQAREMLPASSEDVAGLRKEIRALPSYKNYSEAFPIYRSMAGTADRNTKASDLNLVYGLGKIFDPGSVVREGEMIMVKNTASLPDWLVGSINQINGGAMLQPETRKAILQEAHTRMNAYETTLDLDLSHYRDIAGRNRMNVADIIPPFERSKPWEPAASAAPSLQTEIGANPFHREPVPTAPSSGRRRAINPQTGQTIEWNGQQWVPAR